jgi:hypothetical protein
MAKSIIHQLRDALKTRQYIRFSRRFEKSIIRGYVLDIGPTFILLAVVNDRIHCDGFDCFRISDIFNLSPDPYAAFVEAAIKKRGEQVPKKPKIDLGGIKELILSAAQAFPLITIHRDEVDTGACWIGRVIGVNRGRLAILEIDPGAQWDSEPTEYRIAEITRVTFGGDYEDALYLVGGNPACG